MVNQHSGGYFLDMKILIAPDSFKGSLSAKEVALICAGAFKDTLPGVETRLLPIADGGEGTMEVLEDIWKGQKIHSETFDALGRKISTFFIVSDDGKKAFIESSGIIGLPLIEKGKRNLPLSSSFGLGKTISDALNLGYDEIIVTLGGSATNDGGMGLMQALGYSFFDKHHNFLSGNAINLSEISSIKAPSACQKAKFTVLCDVENPLLGENGATYVYSPQKGATPDMLQILEEGMKNYADKVINFTGKDLSNKEGAGAAGGLGFAFLSFLDAKLKPGASSVLDMLDFDRHLEGCNLVVTGEGKLDCQTLMGKAPMEVLKRCKCKGLPVIGIAGNVTDFNLLNEAGFLAVFPIVPCCMPLEKAMQPDQTALNLKNTIKQIARILQFPFIPEN